MLPHLEAQTPFKLETPFQCQLLFNTIPVPQLIEVAFFFFSMFG